MPGKSKWLGLPAGCAHGLRTWRYRDHGPSQSFIERCTLQGDHLEHSTSRGQTWK